MTTGNLLWRGMIVGLVAGVLSFGLLKLTGEPAVDRAIAFETAMDEAKAQAAHDEAVARGENPPAVEAEPELVSRPVQAGVGLLTGVTVYNTAFGGLFALVFALCHGRIGGAGARWRPRITAAVLALSGFVAVYLVPILKYPANPPSVGNPDTIGLRTGLFFAMIVLSLLAMIAAWNIRARLSENFGAWNATLAAGAFYILAVAIFSFALPPLNEVPEGFPAVVLWQFRIASLGAQALMWATIGLGFGAWIEHDASAVAQGRLRAA